MTTSELVGSAFPAAEYVSRTNRVRERANGTFDVLVVTDPKNIFYLTGYDAYSYYVPQALVVPVSADEPPLLVLRRQDLPAARWTTHLSPEQLVGYGDEYIIGSCHPMEFVASMITERGWGKGVIGVEFDGSSFSPRGMHALESRLGNATFVDMDRLIEWVRCVKSEREVDVMREAGVLSDHAMRTAVNAIEPGVPESIVAAKTYAALVEGVDGLYGSAPWQPYMSSGEQTNSPHMRWGPGVYQTGRPIMIELGGHRHNYAAGLSRTIYLGRPSASYQDLEGAVVDGLLSCLPTLRSGNAAGDVEIAWRRAVTARGVEKNYRIGYSIGISFPDTAWVERTISLAPGDHSILEPNMTIHLMLAVWLDCIGYSLSETFVVTEGEPERLSRLPWELVVK